MLKKLITFQLLCKLFIFFVTFSLGKNGCIKEGNVSSNTDNAKFKHRDL